MIKAVSLPGGEPAAVGIIVRSAPPRAAETRPTAFVWGQVSTPTATLPFGRWKPGRGR
jgi:hypothetical protein